MEKINLRDTAKCQFIRNRRIADLLDPHGVYGSEHIRGGKIIRTGSFPNVVTVEGKKWMLDTVINNVTNVSL